MKLIKLSVNTPVAVAAADIKLGDRYAVNWEKKTPKGEWWLMTVKALANGKYRCIYDYDAQDPYFYSAAYLARCMKLPRSTPQNKNSMSLDRVKKLAGESLPAAKPAAKKSTVKPAAKPAAKTTPAKPAAKKELPSLPRTSKPGVTKENRFRDWDYSKDPLHKDLQASSPDSIKELVSSSDYEQSRLLGYQTSKGGTIVGAFKGPDGRDVAAISYGKRSRTRILPVHSAIQMMQVNGMTRSQVPIGDFHEMRSAWLKEASRRPELHNDKSAEITKQIREHAYDGVRPGAKTAHITWSDGSTSKEPITGYNARTNEIAIHGSGSKMRWLPAGFVTEIRDSTDEERARHNSREERRTNHADRLQERSQHRDSVKDYMRGLLGR